MRYLFGFVCVLALGVMGCSETTGTGGTGGNGAIGGDGGSGGGGSGGSGGTGGGGVDTGLPTKAETEALCREWCECTQNTGEDCMPTCLGFDDWCSAADHVQYVECMVARSCEDPMDQCLWGLNRAQCVESAVEQCRVECPSPPELQFRCQVAGGSCDLATACMEQCDDPNGAHHCTRYGTCDAPRGACEGGGCTASVFECSEQGIRDAIAAGGGPHTFDCGGPTTVVTEDEIVIDNEVILDGEGNLTIDGNDKHRVFFINDGVAAELRGMTVTRGLVVIRENPPVRSYGGCIRNDGVLTLTDITVTGCSAPSASIGVYIVNGVGGGIFNFGTMTLSSSTVSGSGAYEGAGIFNASALVLTNTALSGNNAGNRFNSGSGVGGGISNWGALTMVDSVVSENTAGFASGGISNVGMVTLIDSAMSDNEAGQFGGAIDNSGALFLERSTVTDNTAGGTGGGIWSGHSGLLMAVESVISGNTASTGGGIHSSGQADLINSIVGNNTATSANYGGGGGLYNSSLQPGTLEAGMRLTGTTVYGNTTEDTGGGIANTGVLTLTNVTLSSNAAAVEGGGVASRRSTMTLASTTVSANTAPAGSAISSGDSASGTLRNSIVGGNCAAQTPIVSLGGNIESPGDTCFVPQGTDQVSVSADALNLGLLADNGGPTETHALLPGSVAIDVIPETECVDADGEPLLTDQRGEPRPVAILGSEPRCDVGAFEVLP